MTEKLAIGLGVVLMGLFALDGADHAATWLVASSAVIVSGAMCIWTVAASRWRQRSQEKTPR